MANQEYFYALGRRKTATARVRLQSGKGTIIINSIPASEYFAENNNLIYELQKPFIALEEENKFSISAVVSGGGHASQADAIRLGIAKALTQLNPDYKGSLKRADMLSRDPRKKERKKSGLRSARKQRQFTKR